MLLWSSWWSAGWPGGLKTPPTASLQHCALCLHELRVGLNTSGHLVGPWVWCLWVGEMQIGFWRTPVMIDLVCTDGSHCCRDILWWDSAGWGKIAFFFLGRNSTNCCSNVWCNLTDALLLVTGNNGSGYCSARFWWIWDWHKNPAHAWLKSWD